MKVLITGGCGFVGSNLAMYLTDHHRDVEIHCADNLSRRGSELNVRRLVARGIKFLYCDVRNQSDVNALPPSDLLIDASAEPSVLAGISTSGKHVLDNNLTSTFNILEWCVKSGSRLLFLSTSRVYPIAKLNAANFSETATRFQLTDQQNEGGISAEGVTEEFSMTGYRSLYGATKYASELLIEEYIQYYHLEAIINRCGMLSGPWQMGKADQGVVALWLARHYYKSPLSYFGFGGKGKQLRDVLHIEDLCNLISKQISQWDSGKNQTFNVGGGLSNTISLLELTLKSQDITGSDIPIGSVEENRPADIRIFVTHSEKVQKAFQWRPQLNVDRVLTDTYNWIHSHATELQSILN